MFVNSQFLFLGDGEGCGGDVGEEVDTVRWMVARLALHSSCAEDEGSVPVATPLAWVVSHDRHSH